MVTFPYGYHMGYNHGKNLAIANNIMDHKYWPQFGFASKCCTSCVGVVKASKWAPFMSTVEMYLNSTKEEGDLTYWQVY